MQQTARECLEDVVSHASDFHNAIAAMPDPEGYWAHQLKVLARMKTQAEQALAPPRPPTGDQQALALVRAVETSVGYGYGGWSDSVHPLEVAKAFLAAQQLPEVGDVVIPKVGANLCSGSMAYSSAVCVQADPFVLVSHGADMRWSSTVQRENFMPIGKASEAVLKRLQKRA
jgi:hypothetical protein